MNVSFIELMGLVAGILTTGSFIPQVLQIIRTRDVSGISVVMYIAFTLGVLLWLVYGLLNAQIALIMTNGITLVLAMTILIMKVRFKD